ncbi:MAG: hypothetical protein SF051_16275 [Elusimicrobiota bacterium]|nr:hypothetical protein [Elusimicrobiota bacterium]
MTRPGRRAAEAALLTAGAAAALAVALGPIVNPDLPWHIAAGRWMAENGRVPRVDFLSWTMAGRPWLDFEWATQLLYYGLWRAGGDAALWAFKSAQFALLAAQFTLLLRQWRLGAVWVALATPAFLAGLFPFLDARPEVFSLQFALLQLHALERRRLGLPLPGARAPLAAHAALYAAWANLHPGFPVGIGLCACYALGEWAQSADRRRLPTPLAWAAAGLAGSVLNPYGPRLYTVFFEHWKDLGALRELVIEWSEPGFRNAYQRGYWAALLLSFGGFLWSIARGARLPLEHVLLLLVFAAFASRAFRTTAYAVLLLYPLGLRAWSALESPPWWRLARPWALAASVVAGSWWAGGIMREQGFLRAIHSHQRIAPERTAAFLLRHKAELSGLKMFNSYNMGGYFDLALHPHYRVFMDGRYLFAGLLARTAASEAHPGRWKAFMKEMGVELAVLENNGHVVRASLGGEAIVPWRAFTAFAMPRSEWALVYWDSESLVMVRRDKAPVVWLARHEYRLLRPRDLRHLGLRLVSGELREAEVVAEIERYRREIGDFRETYTLDEWLRAFRRGLAAAEPKP